MRLSTTTIVLAALLFSRAASAGGSDKDPGKGAPDPSAPPADANPGGGGKADDQISEVRDTAPAADTSVTPKVWEVGVGVEYHHILDAEDVDNDGSRNVEAYTLFGRWDVTPYDRLSIRWGLFQGWIIDSGDSPVRADDISVSYTRRIPLPGKVTLRATAGLTAPISYGSQISTLITSPRVSLQADRRFGHLTVDARVGGTVFIFRDTTGGGFTGGGIAGNSTPGTGVVGGNGPGASPNPKGSLTMVIGADFSMPFYDRLSVGLSLYDGYSWVYNVGCSGSSSFLTDSGLDSALGMPGSTACPPTTNGGMGQPFFQAWGGEVHVNYALPTIGGFKGDLSAAFAPNGDPSIGYASVTHGTGINQTGDSVFYYRQSAEVYFGLTARY